MVAVTAKTCRIGDCIEEALSGRELCAMHQKRQQRGNKPPERAPRTHGFERVREAALAFAEADSEDDTEFERADQRLREASKAYGRQTLREAMAAGIERARAKGVRFGRPPRTIAEDVGALVKKLGKAGAAKAMGVSRVTLWRAMKRGQRT